jgi:hypothetical protein
MSHEASGDPALDDDFRSLFRPDTPGQPVHAEEIEDDDVVVEAPRTSPETSTTSTRTGRLFRSAGASESETAILALRPDQARKLRSTQHDEADLPSPEVPVAPPLVLEGLAVAEPAPVIAERPRRKPRQAPGLRPGAVYAIDVVVVVAFAFLDITLRSDGLGWITGVGLILAAVGTALVIRLADWPAAVIAPPLAFLAAAVTAGQMNLGPSGDSILNRVAHLFFTLGANWLWIVIAVALAFAITQVRQRVSARP